MEFQNSIPEIESHFEDFKPVENSSKPADSSFGGEVPPPYDNASDATPSTRWTPDRIARYDFTLHLVSGILAISMLVLFAIDVHAARRYSKLLSDPSSHSGSLRGPLPASLVVVDTIAIAIAALIFIWAWVYLRVYWPRAKKEVVPRKWSTATDVALCVMCVAISDTTLAMRTSPANCTAVERVGGCEEWRRRLMLAAGIVGVILS
jgi:hypothetical protein